MLGDSLTVPDQPKTGEARNDRKEDIEAAREDLVILHPLPKVNEIEAAIDGMKQARYFDQAHYGIPVREAILEYTLG